jgi:hypothetical protein
VIDAFGRDQDPSARTRLTGDACGREIAARYSNVTRGAWSSSFRALWGRMGAMEQPASCCPGLAGRATASGVNGEGGGVALALALEGIDTGTLTGGDHGAIGKPVLRLSRARFVGKRCASWCRRVARRMHLSTLSSWPLAAGALCWSARHASPTCRRWKGRRVRVLSGSPCYRCSLRSEWLL